MRDEPILTTEEEQWREFMLWKQDERIPEAQVFARLDQIIKSGNQRAIKAMQELARLSGEVGGPTTPSFWSSPHGGSLVTGMTTEAESFGLWRADSHDDTKLGLTDKDGRLRAAFRRWRAKGR